MTAAPQADPGSHLIVSFNHLQTQFRCRLENDYRQKQTGYYNSDRTLLISHFPSGVRTLLDIGCAEGKFGMDVKRRHGAEVWGIEPFGNAAKIAAERLDKVYSLTVEEALEHLPADYFDCISFNDVLEHLVDPWNILKRIGPYLKENGTVFACIPNVMYREVLAELLFEGDWKYRDAGVLDRTHLRFFTRKSILRMFAECGYQVHYIEGLSPGTKNRKLKYLNRLIFNGRLDDMQFIQFVVCARQNGSSRKSQ